MELDEILKRHKVAIDEFVKSRPNPNPSGDVDEEIQLLKRENGDLRGTMRKAIQIMKEKIQDIERREGKDTMREGPKVHSPVRDSQLTETASTPSSDISDGTVEHGVNSTQLTRKHQTQGTWSLRSQDRPGSNDLQPNVFYEKGHPNDSHLENTDHCSPEEESILDPHGSDSEGQLDRSSRLTKTEPRESDDEFAGVKRLETCRRVKDASQGPKWGIDRRAKFGDVHRRFPIRPSS